MNGEIMLGLLLVVGIVIGVAYLVAVAIEKYKKSRQQTTAKNHSSYYANLKSKQQPYTKEEDDTSVTDVTNARGAQNIKGRPEIDAEIAEVTGWIGVSEPADDVVLVKKIIDGKEKEVINEIAKRLSLPMQITIKYNKEVKYNDDGSTSLAEVTVGNIPHYGSKYLEAHPCIVTLYPGYNSSPDRLISVIAHELNHYVLQSLRPRLPDSRKEERQTDLAVIFGGFKTSYSIGRKNYANGTAGYLLDDEVDYIYAQYEAMLANYRKRFFKIRDLYKKLLKDHSDTLLFVKMCELLLAHPDEKITSDDMDAVSKCLSLVSKKEISRINKLKTSLDPFLKDRIRYGKITHEEEDLKEMNVLLRGIGLPAAEEISVLMKYTDKYKS